MQYCEQSGNQTEAEEKVSMADPIGTIKNISELIKKYNGLELMKQIVSLQTEVFELQTENLTLRKEIAGLNERVKNDPSRAARILFQRGRRSTALPEMLGERWQGNYTACLDGLHHGPRANLSCMQTPLRGGPSEPKK